MDSVSEQPLTTTHEKKEAIYQVIERRIDTFKTLWKVAQGLPIPSPNDTPELLDKEQKSLRGVFESALAQDHQGRNRAKRMRELHGILFARQTEKQEEIYDDAEEEVDESLNQLTQEYQQLAFEDPGVQFLTALDKGTQTALEHRQTIREIMKNMEPGDKIPSKYIPEDHEELFKHILRVWPQRFSIGIVVDKTSFGPYASRKYGPVNSVKGLHPTGTIWSIVKETDDLEFPDDLPEDEDISDEEFEKIERKAYATTLRHEDFHAFTDGFLPETVHGDLNYELDRMKKIAERINRYKAMQAPPEFIAQEIVRLKTGLNQLINANQNELIAEFVSIEDRNDRPTQTFAKYVSKKRSYLQKLKGIDPGLDVEINDALKVFSVQVLRDKIKALYGQVATKAPSRREDLDAAFVLFPLSQMRHIERLVDRWTLATP